MRPIRPEIDPAILPPQFRRHGPARERTVHDRVAPPGVFLAFGPEAEPFFGVAKVVVHDAEDVVDEGGGAGDELRRFGEEGVVRVGLEGSVAVGGAGGGHEEVVVEVDVEDGLARVRVRSVGAVGFVFDVQAGRFDDLPLGERLDAEGSVRGCGRGVRWCR